MKPKDLDLHVTLWPSMPHFQRFAHDPRLRGVRLNSAMVNVDELEKELEIVKATTDSLPLYFDIKARQLRVTEVKVEPTHLEIFLNHPIEVECPAEVLFKAGSDFALLERIENGNHLIFEGGPKFLVKPGESIHIRHHSLKVSGKIFTDIEMSKIDKVVKAGFKRFYLSYVEDQEEIDILRGIIGKDSELILKIESKKGLNFVANKFRKNENTTLMAARGDLYVEIDKPHQILEAMKLIIHHDRKAFAGSRMLLSCVTHPVPECADFSELAWLYDIGYRTMLLCDELCLKEKLLGMAVSCFDAFRQSYARDFVEEDAWEK